ncbi:DHS-like NAD/FAD-binding domain-containing protein [Ascodesmis nigricans]|uniref:DHS-like NAD/FAD-binding domain-containing protein n=1 Tax=Ascodesmis nigricans TaxID=341454 RepID=A0A4V3SIC8_9PEZI|nr:DHS-like NAD/FAD-binding domain-containing protein [Ascodesmis nigricans]
MSSNIDVFHSVLRNSRNILAVCGAGLSASSGLPTFRGAGGMWRTHDATLLATPEAFELFPSLVWQFYSLRRHAALQAKPNPAHYALAELSKNRRVTFKCVTQNVDGLSVRAGHENNGCNKAEYIHGSLFKINCSNEKCSYEEFPNFNDPIAPALAMPIPKGETWQDIPDSEWPEVKVEDLPHCPECHKLLRPGVVWFGEELDTTMLDRVDKFIREGCDLCIVIGTSGQVYPAAGYSTNVKERGGKVAIVDMNPGDYQGREWRHGGPDFVFAGDAAELLPKLLEPVTGELKIPEKEPGWNI